MCGRYTLKSGGDAIVRLFGLAEELEIVSRYNVAPTQQIPVVLEEDGRKLEEMHWGLIPSWSKDPSIGARIDKRPGRDSFREALFPKRIQEAPVFDSCRRILRVEERAGWQAAVSSAAGRRSSLRVRGIVGELEYGGWRGIEVCHNYHHGTQRGRRRSTQPDARDTATRAI